MEIRIAKPGKECSGSSKPFEHGEDVVSVIRMNENRFERQDYASVAWTEQWAEGAIAVWSTKYIDPAVADQQPPEVFSPLRQSFYEAVEGDTRIHMATAFLAAELLRRQKVFRLIKHADGDDGESKVALYTDRIGNRIIEVRDPFLTLGELEKGRIALMERLSQLEQPANATDEVNTDHGKPAQNQPSAN
ncbi:MAG: hypothetical protein AMXMBFR84_33830 [Candidatus Hydrogenedentota bacterium]